MEDSKDSTSYSSDEENDVTVVDASNKRKRSLDSCQVPKQAKLFKLDPPHYSISDEAISPIGFALTSAEERKSSVETPNICSKFKEYCDATRIANSTPIAQRKNIIEGSARKSIFCFDFPSDKTFTNTENCDETREDLVNDITLLCKKNVQKQVNDVNDEINADCHVSRIDISLFATGTMFDEETDYQKTDTVLETTVERRARFRNVQTNISRIDVVQEDMTEDVLGLEEMIQESEDETQSDTEYQTLYQTGFQLLYSAESDTDMDDRTVIAVDNEQINVDKDLEQKKDEPHEPDNVFSDKKDLKSTVIAQDDVDKEKSTVEKDLKQKKDEPQAASFSNSDSDITVIAVDVDTEKETVEKVKEQKKERPLEADADKKDLNNTVISRIDPSSSMKTSESDECETVIAKLNKYIKSENLEKEDKNVEVSDKRRVVEMERQKKHDAEISDVKRTVNKEKLTDKKPGKVTEIKNKDEKDMKDFAKLKEDKHKKSVKQEVKEKIEQECIITEVLVKTDTKLKTKSSTMDTKDNLAKDKVDKDKEVTEISKDKSKKEKEEAIIVEISFETKDEKKKKEIKSKENDSKESGKISEKVENKDEKDKQKKIIIDSDMSDSSKNKHDKAAKPSTVDKVAASKDNKNKQNTTKEKKSTWLMAAQNLKVEVYNDKRNVDKSDQVVAKEEEKENVLDISKTKLEDINDLMTLVRKRWNTNGIPDPENNLTSATSLHSKNIKMGKKQGSGALEGQRLCCLNLYEDELDIQNKKRSKNRRRKEKKNREKTLGRLHQQIKGIEDSSCVTLRKMRNDFKNRKHQLFRRQQNKVNDLKCRQNKEMRSLRSIHYLMPTVKHQRIMQLKYEHSVQLRKLQNWQDQEFDELQEDLQRSLNREVDTCDAKINSIRELIAQLESVNDKDAGSEGKHGPVTVVVMKKAPCKETQWKKSTVDVCLPAAIAQASLLEDDVFDHFYRY